MACIAAGWTLCSPWSSLVEPESKSKSSRAQSLHATDVIPRGRSSSITWPRRCTRSRAFHRASTHKAAEAVDEPYQASFFFLLSLFGFNSSPTMDVPLFGDQPNKRKRAINLGGTHTATTHSDILQEARLRRLQRNDNKRRQDAAIQIQRTWRSYIALSSARRSLRFTFDQDVSGLTALRCLVLLGLDEDALGRWSTVLLASRKGMHIPSSLLLNPLSSSPL